MTKIVLISVVVGGTLGYLFMPDSWMGATEYVVIGGLSALLFFVGVDIGREGTAWQNLKKAGARILAFPLAVIVGTLAGAAVGSLFFSVTMPEAMAVGSGFGWYTLAPLLLDPYSAEISAMSFMYNVFREMFGIILIPVVAKRIGYIECVSLPGAAAMDVCLPIVEKSAGADMVVYSFVTGTVLSASVPILVPLFIGM